MPERMHAHASRDFRSRLDLAVLSAATGSWHVLEQWFMSSCQPKYVGNHGNHGMLRRVTSLVAAQAKATKWMQALHMSDLFKLEALEPDLMLIASRLSALEKGSAWRAAVKAFVAFTVQFPGPGAFGLNSLLSACANVAAWCRALALLAAGSDVADLVSCNAVLTGLSRSSRWSQALGMEGWQHHALDALGNRSADGLLRCNNVIAAACSKGGRWERAMFVISGLGARDLQLDSVSLRTAVSALEKGMFWNLALRALQTSDSSLALGVAGFNSAISACSKVREWVHALRLMGDIRHCALRPTLVSWAAAVGACHDAWPTCCSLLQGSPSEVSFGAASEACAAGGEWVRSLALLVEAPVLMLELDSMTWDGFIGLLSTTGRWSQALSAVEGLGWSKGSLSPVALEATVWALLRGMPRAEEEQEEEEGAPSMQALPKALSLARAAGLVGLARVARLG